MTMSNLLPTNVHWYQSRHQHGADTPTVHLYCYNLLHTTKIKVPNGPIIINYVDVAMYENDCLLIVGH